MSTVKIEATLSQIPTIVVKLLHRNFDFKVLSQWDYPPLEEEGFYIIEVTHKNSEIDVNTVKTLLQDPVPYWAEFHGNKIECVIHE